MNEQRKTAQLFTVKNKRFLELDALRGLAALAVVLFHFTVTFEEIIDHGGEKISFGFYYGDLGVHLFFLISGFVILMTARKRNSPWNFLKARAIRLYPAYWVSLGITALFIFGLPYERLQRPMGEVILNLTMLQSFIGVRDFDGVYWSLAREIIFYFLIAIGLLLFKGKLTHRFITAFTLCWSVLGFLFICSSSLLPATVAKLLLAASVARYAPLFSLGMVLYIWREDKVLLKVVYPLLALAFLDEGLMAGWTSALILLAIIGFFACVARTPQIKLLQTRILVWFGAISYPLYLLHQNISYAIIDLTIENLGPWISRLLAFTTVVLLAWLVHELIEKKFSKFLAKKIHF